MASLVDKLKARAAGSVVTVQKGDTLWELSRQHGVTLKSLMEANRLTGDLIHPGQQLTVPPVSVEPQEEPASSDVRIVGTTDDAKTIPVEVVSSVPKSQPVTSEAAPQEGADEWDTGLVVPLSRNRRTGEIRLAVPGLVSGLAESAKSGATLPGDVFAGRVDPMSDEAIRRSADLATSVVAPGVAARGAASRATIKAPAKVTEAAKRRGVSLKGPEVAEDIESRVTAASDLRRAGSKAGVTSGQAVDEAAISGTNKALGGRLGASSAEVDDAAFQSLAKAAKFVGKDPDLAATATKVTEAVAKNDSRLLATQISTLPRKQLMAIKNRMSAKEWQNVSASVMNHIGMDDAGAFSAAAFQKTYGSIPQTSKDVLFGRTSTATRQRLDDLSTISAWAARDKGTVLLAGGSPEAVAMGRLFDQLKARQGQEEETPTAPEGQGQAVQEVQSGGVSFLERLRQRQRLQEAGIHTAAPGVSDTQARQQFLMEQAQQQGFDPIALGEPGFDDLGARFDIGLSDTFDEKRNKFISKFPEGDFIEVAEPPIDRGRSPLGRGGKTILFRRNPEEPFSEFDAGALDKFEMIGDLSDLSADLPAAAMEIAVTRGANLAIQTLLVAAGSITGDTAKEIVESLRGYQRETFKEQATRIGTRALIGAGGAAASTLVTGPLNTFRGAATFKVRPEAMTAQTAARELGIPSLLPNQIATSPILQRIGKQSQATVATIGEYIRNQQKMAVQALSQLRDEDALRYAAFAPADIAKMHDDAVRQITAAAKGTKTSLTEGGSAIQHGIVEYENLSGAIVDRAYQTARQVGTPDFDINPALATAQTIRRGTPAPTPEGELVQLQAVSPEVLREIQKLEALDPSLPSITLPDGTVVTGTDYLRAIRTNLWNLKQLGPMGLATPEERRSAAQAAKLYSAVDYVLKNPRNADPDFVAAWAHANGEAAKRFSTMEKLIIVQASKSETPAQMASRLAKPLQVDNLQILKDTVPGDQYGAFQAAVKADFIAPENIDKITTRLDQFDKETLDLLFTQQDQRVLRKVGREIDRLNQAGIKDIVARQGEVGAIVRDLTVRSDKAGINEFVKRVSALPIGDPRRKTVRAGIIEDVWNNSVGRSAGGPAVDGKALASEIKRLRESGAIRLLTPDDIRIITRFDEIADFLKSREDAGTSLAAASTAAGVRGLSTAAIVTLLETIGTGRFFTSAVGQRILLGTGKEHRTFPVLRALGAILAQTSLDLEDASSEDTSTPPR